MEPLGILTYNIDIDTKILSYLDIDLLKVVSLVCKHTNATYHDNQLWLIKLDSKLPGFSLLPICCNKPRTLYIKFNHDDFDYKSILLWSCSNNSLRSVMWVHNNSDISAVQKESDIAAGNGNLDILKWLAFKYVIYPGEVGI